jgi:hypothetical protein
VIDVPGVRERRHAQHGREDCGGRARLSVAWPQVYEGKLGLTRRGVQSGSIMS